jgi:hypothetical protein
MYTQLLAVLRILRRDWKSICKQTIKSVKYLYTVYTNKQKNIHNQQTNKQTNKQASKLTKQTDEQINIHTLKQTDKQTKPLLCSVNFKLTFTMNLIPGWI